LIDAEIFFKNKAEDQIADGICFACAGTGINKIEPLERVFSNIKGIAPGRFILCFGHSEKAVTGFNRSWEPVV